MNSIIKNSKPKRKSFNRQLLAKLEHQIKLKHEALAKAKEAMWEFGNEPSCSGSAEIGFHEGRIALIESLSKTVNERSS